MTESESVAPNPAPPAAAPPTNGADTRPLPSALQRLIELVVPVLGVGVPVLYVLGRVYTEAYWQALGLGGRMPPQEAADYLYAGFLALLWGTVQALGVPEDNRLAWGLATGFVVVLLVGATLFLSHQVGRWLTTRLPIQPRAAHWRTTHQHLFAKVLQPTLFVGMAFYGLLAAALSLFLVVVISVYLVAHVGQARAHGDLARIARTTPAPRQLPPTLVDFHGQSGATCSGRLLSCSGGWCVVYVNARLVAFPEASVVQIRTPRIVPSTVISAPASNAAEPAVHSRPKPVAIASGC